jgi:MFS family permease
VSAADAAASPALTGLHGWQWLFMLEGIPPVLLGVVVLLLVPDSVSEARWLSSSEKELLAEEVRVCVLGVKVYTNDPEP